MKYTVLGKRPVSFTANDGRTISGVSLFLGADFSDADIAAGSVGLSCDKFFLTAEKLPKEEIIVGKDVEVYFNRYGKIDKIMPV